MGEYRRRVEQWLSHEQRELDDTADEAFAEVFATVPIEEPSTSFVQRTVEVSWQARARRRQRAVMAVAASLLVAWFGGAAAYGAFDAGGSWLLTFATSAATGSTLFTVMAATTVMEWWTAGARIGSVVTSVMAVPQGAATLAAIELVGATALYMLHRLLRGDITLRGVGMQLC